MSRVDASSQSSRARRGRGGGRGARRRRRAGGRGRQRQSRRPRARDRGDRVGRGWYDQPSGRFQLERPGGRPATRCGRCSTTPTRPAPAEYWRELDHTIETQRREYMFGRVPRRLDRRHGLVGARDDARLGRRRNPRYLRIAMIDESYIRNYWDDVCGGGVWWDILQRTYKNAISIELYIKLAAPLHNRVKHDRVYLARAIEAWRWLKDSGMQNGDGPLQRRPEHPRAAAERTTRRARPGPTTRASCSARSPSCTERPATARLPRRGPRDRRRGPAQPAAQPPDGVLTEPCEHEHLQLGPAGVQGASSPATSPSSRRPAARPSVPQMACRRRRPPRTPTPATRRTSTASSRDGPSSTADIARQESAVSLLVAVLFDRRARPCRRTPERPAARLALARRLTHQWAYARRASAGRSAGAYASSSAFAPRGALVAPAGSSRRAGGASQKRITR